MDMEDPAATAAVSVSARRRSFSGSGVHVEQREDLGCRRRRVQELEATVARLRVENEATERAAAALRAELEFERFASETATSEVMLMIGRLQREKAAAMIEAREFRRIADGHAGRVRELQDQLAAVCALAASYQALLRAHGIDPHEPEKFDRQQEESVVGNKEPSPSPSPPPAAEEFEDKYAVEEVRCAAVPEERVADVAGDLCARVEALEADSAAVRREVAALRAERAQEVLPRRLCEHDAAEKQQRFSVLGIFKWFFSPISWGMKLSASVARKLPNIINSSAGLSTTCFLLGLLPLLERSKGTLQIQSKTSRQAVHSHGQEYFTLCYFFQ